VREVAGLVAEQIDRDEQLERLERGAQVAARIRRDEQRVRRLDEQRARARLGPASTSSANIAVG
jgi:hypothetical protein